MSRTSTRANCQACSTSRTPASRGVGRRTGGRARQSTRSCTVYGTPPGAPPGSETEAPALRGFSLWVVTPPGYGPQASVVEKARSIGSGNQLTLTNHVTVDNATAIYTDVWASMGQEDERAPRRAAFTGYQVNQRLMDAAPGAVFMHCLPAHRGEEVTDEVIDGPRSVVFQQAENRLYAQMALMAELLG